MSFEPDVLQGFVQRYLDTVAGGSADAVAALYAEDATLEDPVGGGEVHIGRQAIAGFYKEWGAIGGGVPNTARTACASARSLEGVPVPWAQM